MTSEITITNLNQQRDALKGSALDVGIKMITTNRDHYQWLAKAYLWWVIAEKEVGYLEEQYASLGKRFKKNISAGINFAPLCWLLWGVDNGLTDDKAGRWSKALNVLHHKYNTEKQYRTDSLVKLTNFIEQSGGVDGLVGYGDEKSNGAADKGLIYDAIPDSHDIGDEEVEESDAFVHASHPNLKEHTSEIYQAATTHYGSADNQVVPLDAHFEVNSEGLGIVFIRETAEGYQVLGGNNKQTVLEPLLAQSYLSDFGAAQKSTRAVYEAIATQCLPSLLQRHYRKLLDNGAVSSKGKAVRRLVYRPAKRDLLLSPIRAESGVVTVAKLKHIPFADLNHDSFLATYSRRAIEAHLIAGRNFNLYAATNDEVIQAIKHGSTTCQGIQVKHKYTKESLDQHWWPFAAQVVDRTQLAVDELKLEQAVLIQHEFKPSWVRKLATSFTEKWFASHGKHIAREHQKVFGLDFTADDLTVHYVMRQGKFERKVSVESPRVLRRLQHLRRWSHEKVNEVFPRSPRARSAHGAGAPWRIPLPLGGH